MLLPSLSESQKTTTPCANKPNRRGNNRAKISVNLLCATRTSRRRTVSLARFVYGNHEALKLLTQAISREQPMQESPHPKEIDLTINVRFGDTDPYGVVYFASYFRYCHHGIEEFLKHHGLIPSEVFRNRAEGFGLPIVSARCDFLRPVSVRPAVAPDCFSFRNRREIPYLRIPIPPAG